MAKVQKYNSSSYFYIAPKANRREIGEDNWNLVKFLAYKRLLVTGWDKSSQQETVEIIHETLIREWGTLHKWINDNQEKLIQKRNIEMAAIEWREKNKLKGYLLEGRKLQDARLFQKQQNISLTLSDLATEFIQKSVKHKRNNIFKLIGFAYIPIILLTVFLGFVGYRGQRIIHLLNVIENAKGKEFENARVNAIEELVKLYVSLNRVNLSDANLKGAKLERADLTGANLKGVKLERADLTDAKLGYAYLVDANLVGANLEGVKFSDADLTGTIFWDKEYDRKAKNITPSQIKQAKNWEKAIYSPEFRKKLGLPPEK